MISLIVASVCSGGMDLLDYILPDGVGLSSMPGQSSLYPEINIKLSKYRFNSFLEHYHMTQCLVTH